MSTNTAKKTSITKKVKEESSGKKPNALDQGVKNHAITPSYTGTSSPFTSRKSRTPIPVEKFNTLPDAHLTERANAALKDIKKAYGSKTFERGNLDAGILRRLGERGYLEYVSGDPASLQCLFKLSKKGLQ